MKPKITLSEAMPLLVKIASDLNMRLNRAHDFNFCAEKVRKYLLIKPKYQ